MLLCFSRLSGTFLARALGSGANNGVVYMKSGGRTGEEAEPRPAREAARAEGGGARVENHNKSDVTRPCGWYE